MRNFFEALRIIIFVSEDGDLKVYSSIKFIFMDKIKIAPLFHYKTSKSFFLTDLPFFHGHRNYIKLVFIDVFDCILISFGGIAKSFRWQQSLKSI